MQPGRLVSYVVECEKKKTEKLNTVKQYTQIKVTEIPTLHRKAKYYGTI